MVYGVDQIINTLNDFLGSPEPLYLFRCARIADGVGDTGIIQPFPLVRKP